MSSQIAVPAIFMRGGTSKGVFFHTPDLPASLQNDPERRDRFFARLIGSPDPYGKQVDGMGAGGSSFSKVVLIQRSQRPDCDIDYLFGAVGIEDGVLDWTANCGNLSAAAGLYGITQGFVPACEGPTATVRIWQANINKQIVAHVPVHEGEALETGDFRVDGVSFPGAPITLDFMDPVGVGADSSLLPTGRVRDTLQVPGVGTLDVTYLNAGNPTVFTIAHQLGLKGTESQQDVNTNAGLLDRLEQVRAHAAVAMGLAASPEDATRNRPGSPKLVFLSAPATHMAAGGRAVRADEVDVVARITSMGKLHHAMTGTGGVAIAVAAAIDGTVLSEVMRPGARPPGNEVTFGHASGVQRVGATLSRAADGSLKVEKVTLQRTARRLMVGSVLVPASYV